MSAIQPATAEPFDLMSEVIVDIDPELGIFRYHGTRTSLEAEGMIPSDLIWPQGYREVNWSDAQHHYSLRRNRPSGAKGPRKAFADCDWWILHFEHVKAPPSVRHHQINREKKALAKKIHHQTAHGIAELNAHYALLSKAKENRILQAFLDTIPGARPPKRGSPRGNDQGGSAHGQEK